jgi:hypothetical protein
MLVIFILFIRGLFQTYPKPHTTHHPTHMTEITLFYVLVTIDEDGAEVLFKDTGVDEIVVPDDASVARFRREVWKANNQAQCLGSISASMLKVFSNGNGVTSDQSPLEVDSKIAGNGGIEKKDCILVLCPGEQRSNIGQSNLLNSRLSDFRLL